jgi:uncharacterized protein YciI
MAYFHLRLVAPRSTFPFDITESERAAMAKHADFWRGKAKDRVAIAVGPVFDPEGAFGMGVVECENLDAAQAIAKDDPVVKAQLGFRYVVSPIPSIILRDA